MPTSEDPAANAVEAERALRALAHTTRTARDPREAYEVLGALAAAAASLSQSLHQIASVHDSPQRESAGGAYDSRSGRAAAYQVSWELHRAGEMMRQVASAIDHAHEVESTITYRPRVVHELSAAPTNLIENGLGL